MTIRESRGGDRAGQKIRALRGSRQAIRKTVRHRCTSTRTGNLLMLPQAVAFPKILRGNLLSTSRAVFVSILAR